MITKADRLNIIEEYYFSTKLTEVNSLIKKGKPIINLGVGSPDLQPPQEALEALKASLTDQNANSYQSYNGLENLRISISKFYNKHYELKTNHSTVFILRSTCEFNAKPKRRIYNLSQIA